MCAVDCGSLLPLCGGRSLLRAGGRLRTAGVPVTEHNHAGQVHGFLWMAGATEGVRRLLDDLGRAVRSLTTSCCQSPGSSIR